MAKLGTAKCLVYPQCNPGAQDHLVILYNIDKMLKVTQCIVLKGKHLPVEIKEIQAGYLKSFYFKDIYLYLVQNKIPVLKQELERLKHWQNDIFY